MGWGALIGGLAIAGGGIATNAQTNSANEDAYNESRSDYKKRLAAAAKGARQLLGQFNEVAEERPGTDWATFVRQYIRTIDDPNLRAAYNQAKDEDFDKLLEFAEASTDENTDNYLKVFDRLSGGKGQEILNKRTQLALETDAASRFDRAYELAAPLRGAAGAVAYDSEGNPIAGQRADAQVFNVAYETQSAVEQEQKQDLARLEQDRTSAAQSQQDKAGAFLQFYDGTGQAQNLFGAQQEMAWKTQLLDEDRAFGLYSAFAQGALGITPTNPSYQAGGSGNALISSGAQMVGSGISTIGKNNNARNNTKNTYG